MESSILRPTTALNTERIQFSSPITSSTGAIMIPFTYDGHPLYIQTPVITCPIGFRLFEKTTTHKLMVNPTQELCYFIQQVDEFVIDSVMNNAENWFGKSIASRDITQALFYNSLKTTKTYPTSMNVRMPFNKETGLPQFTVFDANREEIAFLPTDGPERLVDLLKGKCQIRLIIANASVWGVGGRYGYGWDCVQMQLCVSNNILTNMKTCLFDDNDSDTVV